MRSIPAVALAFLGALALLGLSLGCGSQESVSQRRRRQIELIKGTSLEEQALQEEKEGIPEPKDAQGGIGQAPESDELALLFEEKEAEPKAKPAQPKASAKVKAPKARRPAAEEIVEEDEIPDAAAGVLQDLRDERAFAREEASYWARMGDEFFAQNKHEEAEKHYRRALDLDPSLDEVRARYNDTLNLQGKREGEVPSVKHAIVQEKSVMEEQLVLEVDRKIEQAKEELDGGDVEQAERHASQAVDYLNWNPDADPVKRKAAQDLLARVRATRKQKDAERQAQILLEAQRQAERDVQEESAVRYRQVQALLRKSMGFMQARDYDKAVETCDRVLELDPENRLAKFWLSGAKDLLRKQRRLKLIQDRLENQKIAKEAFAEVAIPYNQNFLFPEEDVWKEKQKRTKEEAIVTSDDPEPVKRIKNALEGTRVNFVFDKTPLEDVVQQLRNFTGANIGIDPQIDAKATEVTMTITDLPAVNALNLIVENVGMAYTFRENILFITNEGQKTGRTELHTYNVSDLLNKIREFTGPELMLRPQGDTGATPISFTADVSEEEQELDPDALMTLIQGSTGGEEAWTDPNSMEYHQGLLLVNASPDLHDQLQTVLSNLRKDADLFVVIEARFIDVNDDFLEDIGVDMRALGAVNNWGTPYGNIINNNATGGQDLGFVKQGSPVRDVTLVMGQDRWAGRIQHIIDGFTGTIRGERITGGSGVGGLTAQLTWLEPFQVNVIIRAVQERSEVRQLTAPVVTAHNGQRVFVSVITQRAYIADYNLVSGGTGYSIIEVADPEVQTFQEGVILDVDPVISHDKKYVTMDVRPTLATLIGGVISTILVSLGSFTNVAFQVPIGVPEISLQQSFTSVTVPNGGTVLLGGFKSLNEAKYNSKVSLLGSIPILNNIFRRKATISEKRSLVILISARIVDLRGEEARAFNPE